MELMFYMAFFNQDISDWFPKKLKHTHQIFKDSKIESENNLPYWAGLEAALLKQSVIAHRLQKQLSIKLTTTETNNAKTYGRTKI